MLGHAGYSLHFSLQGEWQVAIHGTTMLPKALHAIPIIIGSLFSWAEFALVVCPVQTFSPTRKCFVPDHYLLSCQLIFNITFVFIFNYGSSFSAVVFYQQIHQGDVQSTITIAPR